MIFEESLGATALGADEIEKLKFNHLTTRRELDELEQANIEQGLDWLKYRRNEDILSDRFIRKLLVQLFTDVWK